MKETLSIKVPAADKARLKALARARKATITQLMLRALKTLSLRSEEVSPLSCFELTRDIFEKPGRLGASKEGDRSVNRVRMRSFGRPWR